MIKKHFWRLAAAAGLLLSVAAVATLMPALGALRVPAVTILRHE